ncbi:MAG: Na+/H+ antiporter NhaA [Rickettsiales bacterium]|nr:Na+/H+ antiporter NhaA [Rickettsiales bacterium]|tara:strand:- start:14727 stop:15893 length:1167 start_codon:yes stop_codon:yes gene_type:complete
MKILSVFNKFVHNPKNIGLLLVSATLLALVLKNSAVGSVYDKVLATVFSLPLGFTTISKPITLWINDGLMAIFFFYVGLEIKRELLEGELNSFQKASLPVFGALGGLIIPILLYKYFVQDTHIYKDGWAIPAATDIAFALAVLSFISSKSTPAMKVVLLAMAIIDDIAAVLIIAFFYTPAIDSNFLTWLTVPILGLIFLNLNNIYKTCLYIPFGLVLWFLVLKSGIHATLAGILFSFFIPLKSTRTLESPLISIEKKLHPIALGLILPIFALTNSGVILSVSSVLNLPHPMTYGIISGLFFGKQLGVYLSVRIASYFGVCQLPETITWSQFYGVSLLMGIGFTMSLFIANLSFVDPEVLDRARLSILIASLFSGIAGFIVLKISTRKD